MTEPLRLVEAFRLEQRTNDEPEGRVELRFSRRLGDTELVGIRLAVTAALSDRPSMPRYTSEQADAIAGKMGTGSRSAG